MELTQFQTFFPPDGLLAATVPAPVARARRDQPARVLIENVGATLVFLGGTTQDVVFPTGPTSATYRLIPGANRVFVLAPGQALFATGSGAGAIVCVSGSDAIPLGWERDEKGNYLPRKGGLPPEVNPAYPGNQTKATRPVVNPAYPGYTGNHD